MLWTELYLEIVKLSKDDLIRLAGLLQTDDDRWREASCLALAGQKNLGVVMRFFGAMETGFHQCLLSQLAKKVEREGE